MSKTLKPETTLLFWYFPLDVCLLETGSQSAAAMPVASRVMTALGHPPLKQRGEPQATVKQDLHTGKDHSVGGDSTQAAEGGLQQIPCSLKLSLGNPEHHCCPPQLPTGHPQCSFLHWLPPSSAAPQYGRIFMSYKETQRIKLSSLGDSVYILHWLSQMPFYFFCRDRVSV